MFERASEAYKQSFQVVKAISVLDKLE